MEPSETTKAEGAVDRPVRGHGHWHLTAIHGWPVTDRLPIRLSVMKDALG
jgi:hypothetical protein